MRQIETQRGGKELAGRLICVAEFEGNKQRYVPWSMEQQAIENRAKGRLARNENNRLEIEAEANPNRFLDHTKQPRVSMVDAMPPKAPIEIASADETVVPLAVSSAPKQSPRTNGGRPIFNDNAAYVEWCCEHQEMLSEKDWSALRTMMRDGADREYLRIHGIDLDALRKLLQTSAKDNTNQRRI